MELNFRLANNRARFSIAVKCDDFDGYPGLDRIWFDGINEPVTPDVASLAGWVLLAPFVSQKIRFSGMIARPLASRIAATWGAPLDLGPVDDRPARFPARAGTLHLVSDTMNLDTLDRRDQPAYRLTLSPLNASGTTFAGGEVAAKTNVSLLGQGLLPITFAQRIAPAMIYADFLGIAGIVVPSSAIDVPPPMKRMNELDPVIGWRELLKSVGFNLQVRG